MIEWWGAGRSTEYYAATEGGGTIVTAEEWLEQPGIGRPAVAGLGGRDPRRRRQRACPPASSAPSTCAWAPANFEYKDDRRRPTPTARDGFFTVGDVGYLDEDGYLFLCDRKSDMIISGGVNIYPAEIEGELLTPPAGRRRRRVRHPARRLGRGDQGRRRAGRRASSPAPSCADELLALLPRTGWPGSSCPKSIDFIDELPRDPNGKLYKRKLRDPYWAEPATAPI